MSWRARATRELGPTGTILTCFTKSQILRWGAREAEEERQRKPQARLDVGIVTSSGCLARPAPSPPPHLLHLLALFVHVQILTQKRARDACSLVPTRAQFTPFTSRKVRILTQKAGAAHNSGGAVASPPAPPTAPHKHAFRPSSPSARGTYGMTVTPSLDTLS